MNEDPKPNPNAAILGIIVDLVAILCLTLLMALKVMPLETGLPIFALLVGAKAMHKPGGPPSSGDGSKPSAVGITGASAALTLALLLGGLAVRTKVQS